MRLEQFINKAPEIYESKSLLYIGTIIRKKGVLELAEIFNKIIEKEPTATLTLIGGDSGDIQTGSHSTYALMTSIFTDNAKANVSYLSKIPYAEVQTHIKKAHVCAFPSFAETLGMVTIESMALQKPVVNTSIGWAQELIDDGVNGFLVHPTQIEAYSNKILNLFDDPKLCLQIGQAARQKVETVFNINTNADINLAYYQSILSKKK